MMQGHGGNQDRAKDYLAALPSQWRSAVPVKYIYRPPMARLSRTPDIATLVPETLRHSFDKTSQSPTLYDRNVSSCSTLGSRVLD